MAELALIAAGAAAAAVALIVASVRSGIRRDRARLLQATCQRTTGDLLTSRILRCQLPAGHPGLHQRGETWWGDALSEEYT